MKKILYFTLCMFAASSLYATAATRFGDGQGVVVGSKANEDSSGFTVGGGDLYVHDDLRVTGNIESSGTVTMFGGLVNVTDVFDDVPATSEATHFDFTISSATLTSATTAITGSNITDPVIPMNVVVVSSAAASDISALSCSGTLTITGYDGRGVAQTEDISYSTNSATGVKAWSDFTSFSFVNGAITGADGDINLKIGIGTILGLSNNVNTSGYVTDSGDVIWAQLNDNGTVTRDDGTLTPANNTWTPDTAGDGTTDVYTIRYKVESR